jgi:hypothetical protein
MSTLASEFQLLEPEYQELLIKTQESHGIVVTPLQLLSGGRSGAILYLVSVSKTSDPGVRHLILKLDRVTQWNRGTLSEIARHQRATTQSQKTFAKSHLAEIVFQPIEVADRISFFYAIAGDSLQRYRPLSAYSQQRQVEDIFRSVSGDLLNNWQAEIAFEKIQPQLILEQWLGYRLGSDSGNIKNFLKSACNIEEDVTGFIIADRTFPNPFRYAKDVSLWAQMRLIDAARGSIHGDLNTNNILANFSLVADQLEGYFLIDFAEFDGSGFLFYDHLYLELSYLLGQLDRVPFQPWLDLVVLLADKDMPKLDEVPTDLSGPYQSIRTSREAIYRWVLQSHPSLTDDLWGQFWLAATAVGLNFSNKSGLSNEERLAALLFSAAHLRRFLKYFDLPMPTEAVSVMLAPQQLSPSVQNIWEDLFDTVHHFADDGRLYFLIVGPTSEPNVALLGAIGRIGWQVVLDFDPNTQKSGLYEKASTDLSQRRSLHIVTSEDDVNISLRRTTYWYAAKGLIGRSGTLPDTDDWLKWSRMYYQHLQQFLLRISSLEELPVTILVLWDDLDYVAKTCEFIYQAFGERAEFVFAVDEPAKLRSIVATYRAKSFSLTSDQFAVGIRSLITSPAPSTDYVLVPALGGTFAPVKPEDVNWIEEEFTLIHMGVGTQDETAGEVGRDFLRGSKISWFELSLHYDVEREKTVQIRGRVVADLEKRLVSRINLYHFPGSGGTTVGLRILWELHKEYTTLILNKVSGQTLERFRKIYGYTQKSILVLVDASLIPPHTLEILYNQVESEHLPVVFLTVARRFGKLDRDTERSFYIPERLEDGEANRFAQVYGDAEPSRREALQRLARDAESARFRIPFFFGLTAFGEDFILLPPYVSSRLQNMTDLERKMMCYLALTYRYAQKALPSQIFSHLANTRGAVRMDALLKEERMSLLVRENSREWRPTHFLIGKEIAEQIIAADSPRQNWYQNLSLWAVRMIEDIAQSEATTFTKELMQKLFVTRDSEDILIEIEEKPKFSRLVQDIVNADGQLAVLQRLVDLFPNEPHYIAHLARFRSSRGEHPRAVEDVSNAVSLEPEDDVLRHIKGSVIKNWVFSLIRDFDKALRRKEAIPDENLQRMAELGLQAESEFSRARQLTPENEYAYVSHVQLLTALVEFGLRRSGKTDMQTFLADQSSSEYRDMIERAETILDQAIRLRAGRDLSNHIQNCENKLDLFYGNYSQVLSSWNQMLEKGNVYRPPIRRSLVRVYLSRQNRSWDDLSLKDLKRIYELMEENLLEEPEDERNIRLWFNAARRVKSVTIEVAIERLTYLYSSSKPLDAMFYLYVMYALKAIEGSDIAKGKAESYIKQCQAIARHKPRGGFSFDWLGNGEELTRLVHSSRLGDFNENTGFYQNEILLRKVRGKIVQANKPESGYIELQSGLRAFFVPQRRHKGATNFGSQDVNKDVQFYLGFSYEGLRAWSVAFA